jgi:hypothetical protein
MYYNNTIILVYTFMKRPGIFYLPSTKSEIIWDTAMADTVISIYNVVMSEIRILNYFQFLPHEKFSGANSRESVVYELVVISRNKKLPTYLTF